MGIYLRRRDTTGKYTASGRPIGLFVFEGPPQQPGAPRRVLNVEWHTLPGAWQAALRWGRRLERGEL